MSGSVALVVIGLSGVVAALTATRRTWPLALLATAAAAVIPLAVEGVVLRTHLAFLGGFVFIRTHELVSGRWRPPWRRRLAHFASLVDSRRLRRIARRVSWPALASAPLYAAIALAGLVLALFVAPELESSGLRLGLRWLGGAVAAYGAVDAGTRLLAATYGLAGLEIPPLHDRPILARSVGEFWSRRWNLMVSRYLRRAWFAPLARRGHSMLGLLAAFTVSGVAHGYCFGAGLGSLGWGVVMASFFVAQFAAVAIERSLRIARRPAWVARLWTIGALLALSPLFSEPTLRVIESLTAGR